MQTFWVFRALLLLGASAALGTGNDLVYVGTYTGPNSLGIYGFRFDAGAGKLTAAGLAVETKNPSYVAAHPNGRFVYAVNEIGNYTGRKSGSISAFSVDNHSGKLALLNTVPSGGSGPCYLRVDKTGAYVLAANYGGGSVAAFPIKNDGSLGDSSAFVQHSGSSVDPKRQAGPHAHMIELSPDNRFAFVPELGLDKVLIYRFRAADGSLTANDPSFATVNPGAGPRHIAFHPDGRFAYVINEMQSTITTFAYNPEKGALQNLASVSTLPKDFSGASSAAEIAVHPSGKFVYGSNRGHDSIAVFTIDAAQGTLKPIQYAPAHGRNPRQFTIDPTGRWLLAANQDSNNIVVFSIDAASGKLTQAGAAVEVYSPVCITFVPGQ